MADYVAVPEIKSANTILLFGNYYQIRPPVRIEMATVPPERLQLGSPLTAQDNPLLSTLTIDDLSHGMGVFRYRSPEDLRRFATGVNVAPLFAHSITSSALSNSSGKPTGETNTVDIITALSGTIIVCFGAKVFNLTDPVAGTWSALIDTLPAVPVDDIYFNARIFYALNGSGYSYQTSASAVAVDVAAGANDPAAHSFALWDGTLYAVDTAGKLWKSSTGNAGSWTGLATLPIEIVADVDLEVYDDSAGDPTIWALTAYGPWIYDPINDKWFQSRFQFPLFDRLFAGRGMGVVYRDSLIVRGSNFQIYKCTMSGASLTVENITPGLHFLPSNFAGEVTSMVADNNHLFALIGDSNVVSGINWCVLMYSDDDGVPVWHPIYVNASDSGTQPKAAAILGSTAGHRLFFHDSNATNGQIVRWINLFDIDRDPSQFTAIDYAASSTIDLPWFDNFEESRDKLAVRVRVKVNGASATESLVISYRADFSTGAFTTLATITANGETTQYFGTNNIGVSFKSIQFRIAHARGATTTLNPKLESFSFDFMRLPEVLRGFTVNVICDGMFFGRSASQQVDDLWTAFKTDTLGTFAYMDDIGNTRSYLVRPLRPQGLEFTGHDEHGAYSLFLAEVRAN